MDRRSEIEEELKWVEDNIPSGEGGYMGGPSDDIGIDINGDASKHKLIGGGSARSEPSNSNYTQLFVFFVIMVVVLNLAMWASGSSNDSDVPSTRGNVRFVPDMKIENEAPNIETKFKTLYYDDDYNDY